MKLLNLSKSFFFLLLFPFLSTINAQELNRFDIPFTVNDEVLLNPLVGGLNDPQFSEVDLNNDGTMDLMIFDRIGDVVLTYINGGTPNKVDYTFAPEYTAQFPRLQDWVLLRDYNGDGIMDIFGAATIPGIAGVEVHRGFYQNGKIAFEQLYFIETVVNVLAVELAGGGYTNLYVSAQDIPAIDDIDGDGDLDIVTFGSSGGYINLFDNQSIEMGYGKDSLKYELKTNCFGGVYESGVEACLCLPETMGACCDGFVDATADTRHAGSTLLTFDADGDNDKELVLGDISFSSLIYLVNGGDNDMAFYNEQDCEYPAYDASAVITSFPASFYLDVDNDGNKDLLGSPNAPANSEDVKNVWYYKNIQDNTNPVFDFQQNDLFTEDMVDMGTGANPTFVDYNQDGLLDIVVGNHSFYKPLGEQDPRLLLYENIGTADAPHFELIDEDYLNLTDFAGSTASLSPTFGDLDNDGDLDLLIGEAAGKLLYYKNVAGPGNPFDFPQIELSYMGIDVGQVSVPQIVDINRDGKPDLVIGERNGNLNFFENIGTPTEPMFHSEEDEAPNNPFFGEVDTRDPNFVTGYSSPVFLDFGGAFMLFCGSESGHVRQYTNIDDNLDGAFTKVTDSYGDHLREGERTHLTFADIDNNLSMDFIIGNYRGGLGAFESDMSILGGPVSTQYINAKLRIDLFPNPASDQLYVDINNLGNQEASIQIYNTIGKRILQKSTYDSRTAIALPNLSAGIYLCEVRVGQDSKVEKFIVK